LIMGQAFFR